MAIDLSGQDLLPQTGAVTINIKKDHPLMQLARVIPWKELLDLIVIDLKATTIKGFWFMGRKIKVRIHLGAYFLQYIYNLTDRKTEYLIKDNAAFQLFCGRGIVEGWYAPDHTKIEEFRSRLSAETQRSLANAITRHAVKLGYANPKHVDFDSTVQEANVAYPSDASLMSKLAGMGKKLADFISENLGHLLPEKLSIEIKAIKKKAREYFFIPKNKSIESKRKVFSELHKLVKQQMKPVVEFCEGLTVEQLADMPWNIRRVYDQIKNDGWRYLLDVAHFIRTNAIKTGKILSFHAKDLACIKKGKLGKEYEFGRVFQLGRLGGNFLMVAESTSVEMNDKKSFPDLLEEYLTIFGEQVLETVATDKGYWSDANYKKLMENGIKTEGMQKPCTIKQKKDEDWDLQEHLQNRRAGIEPIIGHVKHGGQLGKSRMKSDRSTLAAGYSSILGFNLRQMSRYKQGKITVDS